MPFTKLPVHIWTNIAVIILFVHYIGGFFSVYGPGRIPIVRLWTVEEPFSISVDSNGSLSVNILI